MLPLLTHLTLRPQAQDAEGVTRVLKAQGQSPCDQHTRGRAPEEPFAVLSLFPSCINYEEQPLLSGIFWCISPGISRSGTGSQERIFLSVLFVFPDPLALSAELFSFTPCLIWALSGFWALTGHPARSTLVSLEGSGSRGGAGILEAGSTVSPPGCPREAPHPPTHPPCDFSRQVGVLGTCSREGTRSPEPYSLSPVDWDKHLPALHLRGLSGNFPGAGWALL